MNLSASPSLLRAFDQYARAVRKHEARVSRDRERGLARPSELTLVAHEEAIVALRLLNAAILGEGR
ncbi:MAG TPA: hypothetical protein VMN04_02525 [Thermoanaerobaculia bacterium]|nr:hypothetical protein [Thermoanaerobaculia bacterium]